MAIDQPSVADTGNRTAAEFAALPDWAFVTTQVGKDDTFATMIECANALLYRVMNENFADINESFACRKDTPLSLKIATVINGLHWRASDNGAQPLTLAALSAFSAASPAPTVLFSCDGTVTDEISTSIDLRNTDPSDTPRGVFAIVSSGGSQGPTGPVVFGLKVSGGPGVTPGLHRYWYADANVAALQDKEMLASVNVYLEWPQSNDGIVLLKNALFDSTIETGATTRMGFEFGLAQSFPSDFGANPSDLVMYLRWFDSSDVEQKAFAFANASSDALSIATGREYTLGFHRFEVGLADWAVFFYVNGVKVFGEFQLGEPDIGSDTKIRLHVGSDQRGTKYVGGPVNNVYVLGSPPANNDGLMNTIYKIGSGHLVP